ncbi:MAG: hypothetical protein IPH26_06815 [Sterolibacteriaceae bacterium]|uniref:Helix-turn-helix domain-containing protein n=1 Tax=Candidatus Methylophosphatis roskildensis TaxID=2899263 RepID=A0A9D7E1Z6_9PROT|nr:hypothetical protein [Candidatus Methylophosphatis roskildensis]
MVWKSGKLGGGNLLVLLAMADYANDAGSNIHPSMSTLAGKVRLSEVQTRRLVHELVADGYLQIVGNENGGAPGATRQYCIVLERLTTLADDSRTPIAGESPTALVGDTLITGDTPITHDGRRVSSMIETGLAHESQSVSKRQEPLFSSTTVELVSSSAADACPQKEVLSLYKQHLPVLPQPRAWEGQRAKNLQARWRWVMNARKGNGERYAVDRPSALEFFRRFFIYVGESNFLTDRWKGCDLGWLVKAENFDKVLSGKYHDLGREQGLSQLRAGEL